MAKQISGRKYTIKPGDNGEILELGPSGTGQQVSTWMIQFNPDVSFAGEIVVMGKPFGQAAQSVSIPFQPIPYRAVSVGNVAGDYSMVATSITGIALIQVPSNGLSVGLLVACTAGTCDVISWDLQGSSAV